MFHNGEEMQKIPELIRHGSTEQTPEAIESRTNSAIRQAVVDIFRDNPPSTVVGYLLLNKDPATTHDIAIETGLELEQVELEVFDLEEEDLAVVAKENGLKKVYPFACFTVKNGLED